jgi:hypothetical protein
MAMLKACTGMTWYSQDLHPEAHGPARHLGNSIFIALPFS